MLLGESWLELEIGVDGQQSMGCQGRFLVSSLDRTGWQVAPLARMGRAKGGPVGHLRWQLGRDGLQTDQQAMPPAGFKEPVGGWRAMGGAGRRTTQAEPGATGSSAGGPGRGRDAQRRVWRRRPKRPVSGVRQERLSASQPRTEDNRSVTGQSGHPPGHSGDSGSRDQHRLTGRPHCLPQPSPGAASAFRAARGPGDRVRIEEGKNKFFVPRTLLPLSHSRHNSVFVPSEANDRGNDAVRNTARPSKGVPRVPGRAPGSELGGDGGEPGAAPAPSAGRRRGARTRGADTGRRHGARTRGADTGCGHCCAQLEDGVFPRTALPLALRSGLEPKHTARCSQGGKVGKSAVEMVKGAGSRDPRSVPPP